MDKLQPKPDLTSLSNMLNLNSTYHNYQWNLDNTPIIDAENQNYIATENGSYCLKVINF